MVRGGLLDIADSEGVLCLPGIFYLGILTLDLASELWRRTLSKWMAGLSFSRKLSDVW